MNFRVAVAEAVQYPVLRITFDDGLAGEYDLAPFLDGPMFASLKDENFFRMVSVSPDGRTFGWKLGELGNEIDFCPDAARIRIETAMVEALAASYRERRSAAE